MHYDLKKTVALVGMMGSGKSAVGTALARLVGAKFLDSDHAIEAAANMSISEIFARDGEGFFRQKETQILARLMSENRAILSTGGGAYLAAENRKLISDLGIAVWLRADADLLWMRVRHKSTRPLLRTDNPRKTLRQLCTARDPVYANAEVTVDADASYSIEDIANNVIAALIAKPDVLVRRKK